MTDHSNENPKPPIVENQTTTGNHTTNEIQSNEEIQRVANPSATNPSATNPTNLNSLLTVPNTRTNQKAIWSLVLGILSLVCCGLLTGIPGWILGAMAKNEIRSSNESGEGLAIAGLVLSIIGTILSVVVIIFYIFIVVGTLSNALLS
jgi:hypothetical protein